MSNSTQSISRCEYQGFLPSCPNGQSRHLIRKLIGPFAVASFLMVTACASLPGDQSGQFAAFRGVPVVGAFPAR